MSAGEAASVAPMWHVTVTVAGDGVVPGDVRAALERLAHEHPFLLAARYAPTRAEVRYWEESPDVETVTGLALRLWTEHRITAGLPDWRVVGVEVVDRDTFHSRMGRGRGRATSPVEPVGVTPF